MDAHWDSVLELCCSKLSPEAELPAWNDEGHLDWLDEKVDLSAWVDLDFPDDLPPAAMTPEAGHPPGADYYLTQVPVGLAKLEDPWQSAQVAYFPSPECLSPPDSPCTPVAIVPDVDVFLNLSPAPSVEASVHSAGVNSPSGLPEDTSDCPDVGASFVVATDSTSLSPPCTPTFASQGRPYPALSQDANEAEVHGVVETPNDSGRAQTESVEDDLHDGNLGVPSASFEMECSTDPTDRDFAPEDFDSESEEERKPVVSGRKRSRARKPPQRRKRKAADRGSRRERKRLQNKDAATRYRRKKRQEYDIIEEEFRELSQVNESLKAEAARVGNEVSYLKGLMRELCRARGLLP